MIRQSSNDIKGSLKRLSDRVIYLGGSIEGDSVLGIAFLSILLGFLRLPLALLQKHDEEEQNNIEQDRTS